MNTIGLRCLLLGAGHSCGGFIAAAIDTYVFDHFESKWGRAWSLQVTGYALVVFALAEAILFGLGQVWLGKRFQPRSGWSDTASRVFGPGAILVLGWPGGSSRGREARRRFATRLGSGVGPRTNPSRIARGVG